MPYPDSFYFLRHGQSENNRDGCVNGQTDSPLTEQGLRQAYTAAERLGACGIEVIVTSPLCRAKDTAAVVAARTAARVCVVPGLMERDWGWLEGRERTLISDFFAAPKGGESWDTYQERVSKALDEFPLSPRTLICAHAGTMRVIRQSLGIGDVKDRLPNAVPVWFHRERQDAWAFDVLRQ